MFTDKVQKGFTVIKPNCEQIQVMPVDLDACDEVEWAWGDNSSSNMASGTSPLLYNFEVNGATQQEFLVSMKVTRKGDNGLDCLEETYCEMVVVDNCCSCNDFEIGFNWTVSCGFVEFMPTGVYGDCDQLTWVWDDGRFAESVGTAGISHIFDATNFYNVNLTVFRNSEDSSCSVTIGQQVTIDCITDIEELNKTKIIRLFPNPTNGILQIELEQSFTKQATLRVLNVWGPIN